MSSLWTTITTSRRQGQSREGLSEGSLSAKVRADEQKSHRRLSPRASQHKMTKPVRCRGWGKCGGCARKVHVLIRGDLSEMALWRRIARVPAGPLVHQVQAHRGAAVRCERTMQQRERPTERAGEQFPA